MPRKLKGVAFAKHPVVSQNRQAKELKNKTEAETNRIAIAMI